MQFSLKLDQLCTNWLLRKLARIKRAILKLSILSFLFGDQPPGGEPSMGL
jgi:transcription termination factor NusB